MKYLYLFLLCTTGFTIFITGTASAQCSSYPVPFEQRVAKAQYIVQGKVVEKHCYIDNATGQVNTLNKFKIAAWLKNAGTFDEIYVITLGGVAGNRAMIVNPALQLDMDHEYLLMLEADNGRIDDKAFRAQHPQAIQALTYADAQGSLTNERNLYHDLFYRTPRTEADLFTEISSLTGQKAVTPSGQLFITRPVIDNLFNTPVAGSNDPGSSSVITSFSPDPTNAGTIVTSDFITISGSAFGAAAGTVFYTNADDGGATFTSSGVATDNTAWSATSITNKPARAAGTGPINVNGAMTSGTNLTVSYSHLNINSTFSGWGSSTRQRYYLVNKNGAAGGYTFTYNTDFAANAPAKAAFERALVNWRCLANVNFYRTTTTSAIATAVLDGVNIVTFDATLPAGVLGRATTRFNGSSTGSCNLANTVWWADELDMQFYPDPPSAGFPWQYGPALPAFTEYDFESVAAHELGHHVGLGHVIQSGALMHFALANGSSVRVPGVNDLAGASAKMSYSTASLCFNPATVNGPMTALNGTNCFLPASLTDFNGHRRNTTTNMLYWKTEMENNKKGFYLQRSKNGLMFEDLAFIKSQGNSTTSIPYSYADDKAGIFPYYYRLKQVDLDAREKLSNIIFIDGAAGIHTKVWAGDGGARLSVYVNSVQDNTVLTLFDAGGRKMLERRINTRVTEIPVPHLAKGIYYYRLSANGVTSSGKLLTGQ